MIRLSLPWPPSVNHLYGQRGNHRYMKAEGKAYYAEVAELCKNLPKQDGRLAVFIDAYPPDNRRRDLDNINKAILDSLQKAGVYADDCQIHALRSWKHEPVKGGRVDVIVCQYRTKSQEEIEGIEEYIT